MTKVYFVRHAQPEYAWKEDRTRPLAEEGGESIAMVQKRNIEVLNKVLSDNPDKEIVIGTHGTALSTILNFYDNSFGCEDFLRIIDWMPYIIELDFEGNKLVGKYEHCHVEKEFKGSQRADKL